MLAAIEFIRDHFDVLFQFWFTAAGIFGACCVGAWFFQWLNGGPL